MMPFLAKSFRMVLTFVLVAIAISMAAGLWRQYMTAPWTRDGRVRADVVDVAPEIAGTVIGVAVEENQFVNKGDPLFQIDPSRYGLAVAQAEAELEQRRQDLRLKLADTQRRAGMAGVVSAEDIDRHKGTSDVAAAAVHAAEAALDVARLNLERTTLRSPVNGYVTNLKMRVGDYVAAGGSRVAVVDADSFWVAGYFEETKLPHIHVGDAAKIALMGVPTPLAGTVSSIGRGIADANNRADERGLPDVNPVFTWVRLAQRIPVKIRLGQLPDGLVLASGMTCSVSVGGEAEVGSGYLRRLEALYEHSFSAWRG